MMRAVTDAADLDALGASAVVLAWDNLAWQAHASRDGVNLWANALDGALDGMVTSAELVEKWSGEEWRVAFEGVTVPP